jgi:uncharacterized protein YndB with AHSA1/START domain
MSTFRHAIDLPATPEAVFNAFKDPALLAKWWGPDGFSNSFELFDFRPGGKWIYTMHGPNGRDYPNESEFLEITPPSLIRLKHTVLPFYDLTISLAPTETGTHVSWLAEFYNESFAEKMRGFLESANEQNLRRLAGVVGDAQKDNAGQGGGGSG